MDGRQYLYRFDDSVWMPAIEDSLLVAVEAAEAIHGRSAINLDADFELDENSHTCRIDGSTAVGRDIARIFVGLLAHDVGERNYTVLRAGPKVASV